MGTQVLQKPGRSGGWNLAAAAGTLQQKTASSGKHMEQAKPRRFWRDAEANKNLKEERAVGLNDCSPISESMPRHTNMNITTVSACAQHSAKPMLDVTEGLTQQAPPKQSRSRGWDLKAE